MFRKDPFSLNGLAGAGTANVFQLPGGHILSGQLPEQAQAQAQKQVVPAGAGAAAGVATPAQSTPTNAQLLVEQNKKLAAEAGYDPAQIGRQIGGVLGKTVPLVGKRLGQFAGEFAGQSAKQLSPLKMPSTVIRSDRPLSPGPSYKPSPRLPGSQPSATAGLPSVPRAFYPSSPAPSPPTETTARQLQPAAVPVSMPATPATASAPATPSAAAPAARPSPMSLPAPPPTASSAAAVAAPLPTEEMAGAPVPKLVGKFQPHIDMQNRFIAEQSARLADPSLTPRQRRRIQEAIVARRGYARQLQDRQDLSFEQQYAQAATPESRRRVATNNLAGGLADQYQQQANEYASTGRLRPLVQFKRAGSYAKDLEDELSLVSRYTPLRRRRGRRKRLQDVLSSESLLAVTKEGASDDQHVSDLARAFLRRCLERDYDVVKMAKQASLLFPELADDLAPLCKLALAPIGQWLRSAGRSIGRVGKGLAGGADEAAESAGRVGRGLESATQDATQLIDPARGRPTTTSTGGSNYAEAVDNARANTRGALPPAPSAAAPQPAAAGGGRGGQPPVPGGTPGGAGPWSQRLYDWLGQSGPGRAARGAFGGLGVGSTFWPATALGGLPGAVATYGGGALAGAVRGSRWFENMAQRSPWLQRLAQGYDYLNAPAIHGTPWAGLSPDYGGLSPAQKGMAQMNRLGNVGEIGAMTASGYNSVMNSNESYNNALAAGQQVLDAGGTPEEAQAAAEAAWKPSRERTITGFFTHPLRAAGDWGARQVGFEGLQDAQQQMSQLGPTVKTVNQVGQKVAPVVSFLESNFSDYGNALSQAMQAPDLMTGLMTGWNALSPQQQRWLLGAVGGGLGLMMVLAGLAGGSQALTGLGALFGAGSATYASGIIQQLMEQGQAGATAQQSPPQQVAPQQQVPALPAPSQPPTGANAFSTLPVMPGRELALATGRA